MGWDREETCKVEGGKEGTRYSSLREDTNWSFFLSSLREDANWSFLSIYLVSPFQTSLPLPSLLLPNSFFSRTEYVGLNKVRVLVGAAAAAAAWEKAWEWTCEKIATGAQSASEYGGVKTS